MAFVGVSRRARSNGDEQGQGGRQLDNSKSKVGFGGFHFHILRGLSRALSRLLVGGLSTEGVLLPNSESMFFW